MTDFNESEFYTRYYTAVAASAANTLYCARLFGQNMAQHGFAEVPDLDHMIKVCQIRPGEQVLDLGCGSGGIPEYIANQTGAHVTGIDNNPVAIQHAQTFTHARHGHVNFSVMDMNVLDFPPSSFDVITTVDTLYFVKIGEFLPGLLRLLKPGGRMAAFFSQSWEPWTPLEQFDRSTIHPDRSELGVVLKALGLPYTTWDYTRVDLDHARRKQAISESLRSDFEAEGNLFLYQNHLGEAKGIQKAYAAGAHGRWLYRVVKPDSILNL